MKGIAGWNKIIVKQVGGKPYVVPVGMLWEDYRRGKSIGEVYMVMTRDDENGIFRFQKLDGIFKSREKFAIKCLKTLESTRSICVGEEQEIATTNSDWVPVKDINSHHSVTTKQTNDLIGVKNFYVEDVEHKAYLYTFGVKNNNVIVNGVMCNA